MINRDNYLVVQRFLMYHSDVMQRDAKTVYHLKEWLKHLLRWADEQSFAKAPQIRPVYPRYLQGIRTGHGKALAAAGIKRGCQDARMFFQWLAQTYRSNYKALTPAWVMTLQPPRAVVAPRRVRKMVTLEMVRQLLQVPATDNDLALRRDKAAAAFLFLSGIRATAFCSLPLHCVNLAERMIYQDPTQGVRTKNSKPMVTRLLEIPDLMQVCVEWDDFVRNKLPDTAMWYPVLEITCGASSLTDAAPGMARNNGLGDNIRKLFQLADLPSLSPHAFRHGHATYALKQAKDIADLKAVSMNLGHSSLTITDAVYAVLSDRDMAERIAQLGKNPVVSSPSVEEVVKRVMSELTQRE